MPTASLPTRRLISSPTAGRCSAALTPGSPSPPMACSCSPWPIWCTDPGYWPCTCAPALKLTSNVPVTAAVLVSGGPSGAPGVFTAASAAVQEQGVVADNLSGSGHATTLVLSAPRGAARIQITREGTAAGQQAVGGQARVIAVKAKHTAVVRLRAPSGSPARSPFAVVITPLPGSGPVYAGRVLTVSGTVESIFPVLTSLTSVPLIPVHDSFTAALP